MPRNRLTRRGRLASTPVKRPYPGRAIGAGIGFEKRDYHRLFAYLQSQSCGHLRCLALLFIAEPSPLGTIPQGATDIGAAPQVESRGALRVAAKPCYSLLVIRPASHAATPATRTNSLARAIRKSAACCAFDAAVKMARLSAFRTFSHDRMYWA